MTLIGILTFVNIVLGFINLIWFMYLVVNSDYFDKVFKELKNGFNGKNISERKTDSGTDGD